jgi:dienelactone hydrolase
MELVMGKLPAPSPLPLDLKVDGETRLEKYTRKHVTFVTEADDRLPGWLLVPHGASADDKRPAMICLPGSSAPGKDRPAGLTERADMAYGHELAERGYVCLVLDYPLLHTSEYKTDPYALKYDSATMKGIVNHRRGVDVLQSLPFVDPGAIGVIGHSLGGHNALFLAVFDERVKAVVSSCGYNVFAKHNGGNISAWSSRYYMPRIKTVYGDDPAKIPFDFTEVLAALAPRPVFTNAPLHDAPDFEVSGVRDCQTAALPVYRDIFQAADRLEVHYPDAGHAFPDAERRAAYAFLDKHLRTARK